MVNSDDEVVAFYSNNRVKKFFKKPFNSKTKIGEGNGKFVEKAGEEEKKKSEKSDLKVEE